MADYKSAQAFRTDCKSLWTSGFAGISSSPRNTTADINIPCRQKQKTIIYAKKEHQKHCPINEKFYICNVNL